jgi:threonine/homoserine/homoserine lactone efflux protein
VQSIAVSLATYTGAATLLTITPGLDTALVLRTAAARGARQAVAAALGIVVGCLCWAVVVALGLGAVLAASHLAYTILRWAGAGYLVWLGYKMLHYPRHRFAIESGGARSDRTAFATGLLTNLLNPKVGIFYVSFLPQFIPTGVPVAPFMVLLGGIHALLGLIWFACLIAATRPISRFLRRPAVLKGCDRLTGGMFVAFGLALALKSQRGLQGAL